MANAMRIEGATLVSRTNVAASRPPITNEVAAKGFQATVIKFSAADLAQAAHRTKSAAKGWKDGSRAPDIASVVNMARALPCVQEWLIYEMGAGTRDAQAMSVDAVIRWARENRKACGMDGDVARAVLRAVAGDEPEPIVIEPIVLDAWKLQDLREERARQIEERKIGAIHDLFEPRRRA